MIDYKTNTEKYLFILNSVDWYKRPLCSLDKAFFHKLEIIEKELCEKLDFNEYITVFHQKIDKNFFCVTTKIHEFEFRIENGERYIVYDANTKGQIKIIF